MLVFTNDKKRLERHFKKDPVLFAYHYGDLDDFYFDYCQWASIYGDRPHIEDVALIYEGGKVPTLLAFGLTDRFGELVADLLDILPRAFYAHYQKPVEEVLEQRYVQKSLGTHVKMALISFCELTNPALAPGVRRLDPSHSDQLHLLYETAYPGNYFVGRMLETGKYFGYFENDRIVAVAGVHVNSDEYGVAVLGNIATHPDYRGRGLATLLTSTLCRELVDEGKQVSLNVKADNAPAIKTYEVLGFERTHEYEEGYFERRQD